MARTRHTGSRFGRSHTRTRNKANQSAQGGYVSSSSLRPPVIGYLAAGCKRRRRALTSALVSVRHKLRPVCRQRPTQARRTSKPSAGRKRPPRESRAASRCARAATFARPRRTLGANSGKSRREKLCQASAELARQAGELASYQ